MSAVVDGVGKVFSGVSDYKHGKAMKNAERASLNTSMDAYGQLRSLMSDPSKITEMPMYKAGLEAVQRTLGQQGLTGSGNAVLGLAEYGGNFYQQQLATLASIARGGTPEYGAGNNLSARGLGRLSDAANGVEKQAMQLFTGGAGGAGGGATAMAGNASVASIG